MTVHKSFLQCLNLFISMSSTIDNPNWIVHTQDRVSGKLVCEMKGNYLHNTFGELFLEAMSKRCRPGQFAHSDCGCWPVEAPPHVTSIPNHSLHFVRGVLNRITDALALPKRFIPPKYFLDYVR